MWVVLEVGLPLYRLLSSTFVLLHVAGASGPDHPSLALGYLYQDTSEADEKQGSPGSRTAHMALITAKTHKTCLQVLVLQQYRHH